MHVSLGKEKNNYKVNEMKPILKAIRLLLASHPAHRPSLPQNSTQSSGVQEQGPPEGTGGTLLSNSYLYEAGFLNGLHANRLTAD